VQQSHFGSDLISARKKISENSLLIFPAYEKSLSFTRNFAKRQKIGGLKNNVEETVYPCGASATFAFLLRLAEFHSGIQTEEPGRPERDS